MRKNLLFFLLLFLVGIAGAQFFGKEFLTTYGFLNPYHLNAFAEMDVKELLLFWNILWERGKLLLGIGILLATPIRKFVPALLMGGFAFVFGFFSAACVMNLGVPGIGVALFFWIPHGIFYILAILLLLYFVNSGMDVQGGYAFRRSGKKRLLSFILFPLLIILLLVIGSLLEATAGTFFLQVMVRFCLKNA